MPERFPAKGLSRRQFQQQLALLAAAPFAVGEAADAQAQPAAEAVAATANALVEAAKAQYGKHLDEQQLQALARSVLRSLRSAEHLKKVPLRNSEAPAFLVPFDLSDPS